MYRLLFLFFILFPPFLNANSLYKVKKTKDFLSCLTPYNIENLNTVYIKDLNGKNIYKIELSHYEGTCKWERDKLLFKLAIPTEEYENIINNYNVKIHLKTNLIPYFSVEKLGDDPKLDGKKITIPYFTLLSNGNSIIEQKDSKIIIKLSKKKKDIVKGKSIIFKNSFNSKDYINLEILSGIYINDK